MKYQLSQKCAQNVKASAFNLGTVVIRESDNQLFLVGRRKDTCHVFIYLDNGHVCDPDTFLTVRALAPQPILVVNND